MADKTPRIVKTHDVHLDSDYVQWIHDITSASEKGMPACPASGEC